MAAPGGLSFKTNVNRAVTKKWKEAAPVSYGGDEYGGDEYGDYGDYDDYGHGYGAEPAEQQQQQQQHAAEPSFAPGPMTGGGRPPLQILPSSRSVTNPVPASLASQASFERGDDRRSFSAGGLSGVGFESAYPTAQRNPFPEIEHDYEHQPMQMQMQMPMHARPPPLSVHTQGYPPPRPGSRGQQRPYADAPYSSLPGAYPSQPGGYSSRHESPGRPDSRSSYASAHQFPPRKSSLSTTQPVIPAAEVPTTTTTTTTDTDDKPTPTFIRPVDIYKRLEEERERERNSLDSSRASIDLNRPRTRDSSASARSTSSDPRETVAAAPADETDSARRLKPTLDTVVERKSEYGFDNLLKHAHDAKEAKEATEHPPIESVQAPESAVPAAGDNDAEQNTYKLPSIDHSSPFGPELAALTPAVASHTQVASQPPSEPPSTAPDIPPAVPAKDPVDDGEDDTSNLTTGQPAPLAPDVPPAVPAKDTVDRGEDDSGNLAADQHDQSGQPASLAHQPSLGYRSLVHQAFDNSQNLNPLSPASRSDTVARSNSASTSDISPIIARRTDPDSAASEHSLAHQTIVEEPAATDRPLSSSTQTPTRQAADQSEPLSTPPPINIGYRRDVTPPNRDNSPAKRPISVTASDPADSTDAAIVPAAAVVVDTPTEDDHRGRDQTSILDTLLAHPVAHTAVGDDEEWRRDKHQPSPGLGLQDSNQTTPRLATPLLRTDSPPKGTVRDITEKLESRSTQSSPATATDPKRPTPLASTESFRPALPGGWQSYTQSSAGTTPANEDSDPIKPPPAGPLESDASTPTAAAAPGDPDKHATSPVSHAFVAAAAAGSAALAGAVAVTGLGLTRKPTEQSEDSSDDEWDKSPVTRSPEHPPVDIRALEPTVPEEHLAPLSPAEESQPPTPLPKDSPVADKTATKTADEHGYTGHEEDYFPAPLRTAKAVDSKATARAPLPTLPLTDDSSAAVDHDQLRRDIVKGLTPPSSRTDGEEDTSVTKDHGLDGAAATATAAAAAVVATAAGTAAAMHAVPQQPTDAAPAPSSGTPQLTHRFSWEADSAARATNVPSTPPAAETSVPETPTTDPRAAYASTADNSLAQSPDTVRSYSHHVSNLVANPTASTLDSPTHVQIERDSQPVQSTDLTVTPYASAPDGNSLPNASPSTAFPQASTLRRLMEIGNHQARVDAYNHNREVYAQSDGLLDQWILSLKGHPEHADVYAPGARPLAHTPTRPSPNRPLPSIGGGKLMQEDGKRLMAAAGRFGGKAGGAAKGLFARGKEKLRHASASGDKASRANPRRLPSGPRPFVDTGVTDASKPGGTPLTTAVAAAAASSSPSTATPIPASAGPPRLPVQDFHASPIDVTDQTRSVDDQVDQPPVHPPGPLSALVLPSIDPTPQTDAANKPEGPAVEAVAKAPVVVAEPPSTPTVQKDAGPVVESSALTPPQQSAQAALTVPGDGRTRSLVSEVSSASPRSTKQGDESHQDHPVSPADDHPPPEERPPSFHSPPPSTAKAVEPVNDQATLSPLASHPVADAENLAQTETSTDRPPMTRPFSFVGSLDPTSPTLPPRPVSQTVTTMSRSQGDADKSEPSAEQSSATNLARDQPAPGQLTETVDPGQLHKTASPLPSPLPSARRPQADFEKPRVQVPQREEVEPDDEEEYRIPGPYHQEFRSPRQSSKPVVSLPQPSQYQQGPWPSYQPVVHDSQSQQYVQQAPPPATQRNPLPPVPDTGRRRSAIGSLFRSRSKREKHEQSASYQDSPTSQYSAYPRTGEAIASTPTTEKKQRRLSKDPSSALASSSAEQGEGRKKRFSGLFSRGSKSSQLARPPQRASTLPIHPTPPGTQGNAAVGPPYQGNNGGYPPGQQFRVPPPSADGYYPPHPDEKAYWPSSQTPPYPSGQMHYQQQPSRAMTALRIDTTNSGQSHRPVATTAPPQTYAPRDISYQSQAYVSPTERKHANSTNISTTDTATTNTTTIPRGPSPHVVALHKRSRSPKLGPYSDQDDAEPNSQAMTSVGGLGTFSNKKISPVGGVPRPDEDQEAPFRITLPGEPPDEEHRPSKQTLIEQGRGGGAGTSASPANQSSPPSQQQQQQQQQGPTVAERMIGPQLSDQRTPGMATAARAPLLQPTATATSPAAITSTTPTTTVITGDPPAAPTTSPVTKTNDPTTTTTTTTTSPSSPFVAELPGSRAVGYESDDDVQMSATAYPGQWQDPVYFDESRWED